MTLLQFAAPMTATSFERMMIDTFDEDVVGKNESVPIIREEAISRTKKSMEMEEKWYSWLESILEILPSRGLFRHRSTKNGRFSINSSLGVKVARIVC